ncbi:MAG: hypothetical protein AAF389_11390 [Gemmatimonadota bacterium]
MHASEVTPEVAARANELYWSSDASVNQIAEELDLSKGALYGAISHLPAELGCPLCGDQVGYPNRTAREREELDCPTCDWDGSPDETTSYDPAEEDPEETARREQTPPPAARAGTSLRALDGDGEEPVPDTVPPRPVILPPLESIAKGALIGGAIGLALVLLTRRR